MFSFRTKNSDRWSDQLTPAGVVDMALRGDEEQWWELYHAAHRDPELRALLARLLQRADPELVGGRRLWLALLARMDAAVLDKPLHSRSRATLKKSSNACSQQRVRSRGGCFSCPQWP